jgi:hypothetical protein
MKFFQWYPQLFSQQKKNTNPPTGAASKAHPLGRPHQRAGDLSRYDQAFGSFPHGRAHPKCQMHVGFERNLTPGATIDVLRVIAYTTDGSDLVTIDSEKAETVNLTVIEDPSFSAFGSPWGRTDVLGAHKTVYNFGRWGTGTRDGVLGLGPLR